MRSRPFGGLVALLVLAASIAGGCGSGGTADDGTDARDANEAVIRQSEESPEAAAERGAPAVRRVLTRELHMSRNEEFRLNPAAPTQCEREVAEEEAAYEVECVGEEFDCYVKTGAEAFAFSETDPGNILRSPNGRDLVFVQTYVGVPLSSCLNAVRDALEW